MGDDLIALSGLAIDARYPGDIPDVSREEARSVVDVAERLLAAITAELRARGLS